MRRLALLVVFGSGCILQDPGVGSCDLQAGTGCRPGFFCAPDGGCSADRCTAGATLACSLPNGDYGVFACRDAGWEKCAATVPPPCSLAANVACVPGYFCSPDGGCSRTRCTAGAVEACRLPNDDYGEHVCGDAGWGGCAATAAAKCNLARGVCLGAVRRFDDPVPGCSAVSYGRNDSGFQSVESCPGDGRDNDCDEYVDEISDDPTQLACGKGLCLTDAGNTLKVYRRCGEQQCPTSRLSTLPGWRPFDTCDGLDLDCSGIPDVGPETTIVEGADEAVALRDPGPGGAWQLAAAAGAPDGGRGLVVLQLGPALEPTGTPKWLGVRSSPSPFAPRFTMGSVTANLIWRDGPTRVAAARILNGDPFQVNLNFVAPSDPIVAGPYVGEYAGRAVLAVTTGQSDGGRISTMFTSSLPVLSSPFETWPTDCSAPTLCLPGSVAVWGDGSDRGFATDTLPGSVLAVVLSRDGGAAVSAEISYELNGVSVTDTSGRGVIGGRGDTKVLLQFDQTRKYGYLKLYGGWDAGFEPGPHTLAEYPDVAAIDVAPAPDGGVLPFFAYRTGAHLTAVAGLDAGVRLSDVSLAEPTVAWSPKQPAHVLVAAPESRPDGGTAVVGRLVCLPR